MIREASPDDLEAVLALENELFPNPMNERLLENEVRIGAAFVIGDPVEAYALIRKDAGLIDLTRLGVSPASQGKGLGRKLLEYVISVAGGQDVMLTVQKTNLKALRLYRSAGFEVAGHLIAATAWVMVRRASSYRAVG